MIMLLIISKENSCMQLMCYHMLQAERKEIKAFKKKLRLMLTMSLSSKPVTSQGLQVYKLAQIEDSECSKVREYCKTQYFAHLLHYEWYFIFWHHFLKFGISLQRSWHLQTLSIYQSAHTVPLASLRSYHQPNQNRCYNN